MNGLSALDAADVEKFVHSVVDGICGHAQPRFVPFAKSLSIAEFHEAVRACTAMVRKANRADDVKGVVGEDANTLSADVQTAIAAAIVARQDELRTAYIEEASAISSNHLTDFDWKMQLSLASDKIATVNEPLLSLNLKTHNSAEGEQSTKLELNKEELAEFIAKLEAINAVVKDLRA